MYYLWSENGQNAGVYCICNRMLDSRLVNMLVFFSCMYYRGFENGKNLDVLVCVYYSGFRELSPCWCSSIGCIYFGFKNGQHVGFYNFMYCVGFENCQHVDVLVFVIVFGIREWSGCWFFLTYVLFWIREWSTWWCSSIRCILWNLRMVNMLMF